jgi:hypothetical protein
MGFGENDVALDDSDSMHLTFIFEMWTVPSSAQFCGKWQARVGHLCRNDFAR